MASERTQFGHYDRSTAMRPWHNQKQVYELRVFELPPLYARPGNRIFCGEFSADGETLTRIAQYDAEWLLNVSPSDHFNSFAEEMERRYRDDLGLVRKACRMTMLPST